MQSSWLCLQVGLEEEERLLLSLARQATDPVALPVDLAIFARHELEDGLHCHVDLFFSPAATPLAPQGARLCAAPSPRGLRLVLGS